MVKVESFTGQLASFGLDHDLLLAIEAAHDIRLFVRQFAVIQGSVWKNRYNDDMRVAG